MTQEIFEKQYLKRVQRSKMRISAVILNKNENPELVKRSILSLEDCNEIIAVDGYSRNGSEKILEEYADKVLYEEGIGKARIRGILAASGDCIISANSDTIYGAGYVEKAKRYMQKYVAVSGLNRSLKNLDIYSVEGAMVWWEENVGPTYYCYEHNLVFRRKDFLHAGIHKINYSGKTDIGWYVKTYLNVFLAKDLIACTRLPSNYAQMMLFTPVRALLDPFL